MNKLKLSIGALAIAMAVGAVVPARAYIVAIESDYEAWDPGSVDWRLHLESELTRWTQDNTKRKEINYTDKVGQQGQGDDGKDGLQMVRGTKGKQNEIITEMRKSAGNGKNAISNTDAGVDASGLKGYSNYDGSDADSQDDNDWVVHANIGDTYSQDQLRKIYEKQGTYLNETAANAVAYGAVETVNAAVDAAQSNKKERAKQMAKATELSSGLELMLGLDRRVYERSLHVSGLEATAAGVEAIQILQGVSKGAEGEQKI